MAEHPRPVTPSDVDPDLEPVEPVDPVAPVVLLVGIAVGGAAGAAGRHGLEMLWPAGSGFPVATLVTNVVGSFLLGALVALVATRAVHPRVRPLLRPVLGTGVLGGFTTFSTYAAQGRSLISEQDVGLAALYLGGTLVAAVAAALAGLLVVEAALGAAVDREHPPAHPPGESA